MTRYDVRRIFRRRTLESAALTLATVTAAVGVARHGSFIDEPVTAPVAQLMNRVVPQTVASKVLTSEPTKTDLASLDHAFVDKWIGRFTGDLKRSFATYLARIDKYDEMIAAKADERGVPRDLVYLAMIESGGNAAAKSPVGARGLWQFMTPTARDYGLTSAERTSPEKSTEAALEYLSDLYDRFGSWYLAAAAYNTGPGRVASVLQKVTGKRTGTDADFYRIASKLPRETRDYVPKLIAATRIAKEPARYGFVGGA
jgi:membrane-bound lytic murein transglycosylase D